MSSKRSRSSRSSALSSNRKPTTLSSKDAAFEQELIDNSIYPPGYDDVEPENLEEIVEKLGQPRASLSPSLFSRDEFLHFRRKNDEATTEAEIMSQVFPMITGKTNIPSGYDQLFNNLKPLGDHISNLKPDYFNGSRTAEIRPKVRNDLEQYIIPSSQRHRPALPNFFMEAKGPDGKASEAKRQITRDLAAGARGMLRMQSYGLDDLVFDNKAHTFGSTYHSGYMQLYAMHPTEPGDADRKPEYHTIKVRGFELTDNLDTHRQGIGAFRNLRDLAKERRAEFIASANETADNDDEPEVASVDTYLTSFISTSQSTQSELFTVDSDHEESDSTSAD
ncbi:Ribonuclease H protein [Rutstroemia sp. NJR-2017a BBW]|nr:Ribonuclease H protein [Rutstroemia sp. NJR-2017a BBW]